jgi:hypothetical protein
MKKKKKKKKKERQIFSKNSRHRVGESRGTFRERIVRPYKRNGLPSDQHRITVLTAERLDMVDIFPGPQLVSGGSACC